MDRSVKLLYACLSLSSLLYLRDGTTVAWAAGAPQGKPAAKTQNQPLLMPLSRLKLTAQADLSQVTFSYHLTPSSRSADVGVQLFVNHKDPSGQSQWEMISPTNASGDALILNLYQGLDNTGKFTVTLNKGTYTGYRLLLFAAPDGKTVDYGKVLYDTANDPHASGLMLNVTVSSSSLRLEKPVLEMAPASTTQSNGNGTYKVVFTGTVKYPVNYNPEDGGFWVMAKGAGGFNQVWVPTDRAHRVDADGASFEKIPVEIELKSVKPGIGSSQFGLFKHSFGNPLTWVFPGIDYEAGGDGWVTKAPLERIPPRLRVRKGRFETLDGKFYDFYAGNSAGRKAVSFLRGGNYGNAITWTITPELDRPGYFVMLKGLGCRFIRLNFNPNRYPAEPLYQHAVDQVVQNIWTAGLYPIICPQDLPDGPTLEARIAKGADVVRTMAAKYAGKSVWLEICNEPHEFSNWTDWKPVAIRYVEAIRKIDPNAFVIVPFEDYGKDGRGAAKSPITETAVDLYDGHAYMDPKDLDARYAPAIRAGLPVIIGEYGGGSVAYLNKMDSALQALPSGLMAASPWAFTVKGQDSLPLVASGDTATLKLTPQGQAIAADFANWDQGKKTAH